MLNWSNVDDYDDPMMMMMMMTDSEDTCYECQQTMLAIEYANYKGCNLRINEPVNDCAEEELETK